MVCGAATKPTLNATIGAAHAGAAGKGFAAAEVKTRLGADRITG